MADEKRIITTKLVLIDRQEKIGRGGHQLVEVYRDPTGRCIRFDINCARGHSPPSTAKASVLDGLRWRFLHDLIDPGNDPGFAIHRMFPVVADLLEWSEEDRAGLGAVVE